VMLLTVGTLPMLCAQGASAGHCHGAINMCDGLIADPKRKTIKREGLWHPDPNMDLAVGVAEKQNTLSLCLSSSANERNVSSLRILSCVVQNS